MSRIRKDVDAALQAFVDRQRPALLAISPDLAPVLAALDALLAGGKRLRPAFCYWGWQAAGGQEPRDGIVAAAASLELLQASALVHDDVMDSSDTRRGQPSAHRRFEALAVGEGWRGGAAAPFGEGSAILLGDLCLAWSSEMYESSGMDAARIAEGRDVYNLMRTEVMCGQYLDLLEGVRGAGTVDAALRVVEFKSAKYTIERPLHLGAVLAGSSEVAAALRAYGKPLGIAFQLRDDVLGVFGDPAETGKPAGDDLREGKRTVLIAQTLERADAAQAGTIERLLGDPGLDGAGVDELRTIIEETGGLAACEAMIGQYADEAARALAAAPITGEARIALEDLTVAATARQA